MSAVERPVRRGNPTYRSYRAMVQRCYDPNTNGYARYGGRGVEVCAAWLGADGFDAFVRDMGERPEGCTLDRVDNTRGYEPANCRWASRHQQDVNKRSSRLITHDGITDTVLGWSRRTGLSRDVITRRLNLGWDPARTLTERKMSVRETVDYARRIRDGLEARR